MKDVLFVKLGAIGDVVMAMTALQRRLEEGLHSPLWITGKTVEPLIRRFLPEVELISVDDRKLFGGLSPQAVGEVISVNRKIAGKHFDRIAMGYRDARYRLLTLTARTSDYVRFPNRVGIYHAELYFQLLGGNITNLSSHPLHPSSLMKSKGRGSGWVLAPGGAKNLLRDDRLRRYPIQHYVELARLALDSGKTVTIVGSQSDNWVQAHFDALPVRFELGTVSLPELPVWLQQFERMITHDSGPMHLAFLAGIPVTALFGPTLASEKVPKNFSETGSLVIQGGKELPCAPCYDGKDYAECEHQRCLSEVTPSLRRFSST